MQKVCLNSNIILKYFDKEIFGKHRTNLEIFICFSGEVDLKLCYVFVEGGPDALELARKCTLNGAPLVIVNNSGRVADVISYAYKNLPAEKPQILIPSENSETSSINSNKHDKKYVFMLFGGKLFYY